MIQRRFMTRSMSSFLTVLRPAWRATITASFAKPSASSSMTSLNAVAPVSETRSAPFFLKILSNGADDITWSFIFIANVFLVQNFKYLLWSR